MDTGKDRQGPRGIDCPEELNEMAVSFGKGFVNMNTTKKMSSHILRTVICFTLVMVILTLLSGTVQAKSKYPKVHSTGEVTLAKGYYFVPPPEDIEGVPSWKKYALIHKGRNSTYVVKVRVPYHYDMCFVGKYKKKYYPMLMPCEEEAAAAYDNPDDAPII